MAAINFSSLPEATQRRVANMRRAWWRPVYVKFKGKEYLIRIIPDLEVGSEAYGRVEAALIEMGWKMVVGKIIEKELVQ